MILRVERIDKRDNSMTFDIDEIPEHCSAISFGGNFYQIVSVIVFASHKLALVKEVSVLELKPSQILKRS